MTVKKHPKRKLFISFLTKTNETPCPSQTTKEPTTITKPLTDFCYVTEPLFTDLTSLIMQVRAIRYSINLKLFSFEFWNLFVTLFYDF